MDRLIRRYPFLFTDQYVRNYRATKPIRLVDDFSSNTDEIQRLSWKVSIFLKESNWQTLIKNLKIPNKLNPDVVRSVLVENQVGNPQRLADFFYWSNCKLRIPQLLDSFAILAVMLCNNNLFGHANGVLNKMIITPRPCSAILNSIICCFRSNVGSNAMVFDILIDSYRKKDMVSEAVDTFLGLKNGGILPSLRCCNSLLNYLLKGNRLELFWKVYDGMLGAKMDFDAYTYTNLASAFCKVGDLKSAKRVLSEMDEKGCSPDVFIFNVVIGGFCRVGAMAEVFELKKSMVEKGLVLDINTYRMIDLFNLFHDW